jgi:hypothetical protein
MHRVQPKVWLVGETRLDYSMIRTTPESLEKILVKVREHSKAK